MEARTPKMENPKKKILRRGIAAERKTKNNESFVFNLAKELLKHGCPDR